MAFSDLGVNRKVVDNDLYYLNMHFQPNPWQNFWEKSKKPSKMAIFAKKNSYKNKQARSGPAWNATLQLNSWDACLLAYLLAYWLAGFLECILADWGSLDSLVHLVTWFTWPFCLLGHLVHLVTWFTWVTWVKWFTWHSHIHTHTTTILRQPMQHATCFGLLVVSHIQHPLSL